MQQGGQAGVGSGSAGGWAGGHLWGEGLPTWGRAPGLIVTPPPLRRAKQRQSGGGPLLNQRRPGGGGGSGTYLSRNMANMGVLPVWSPSTAIVPACC